MFMKRGKSWWALVTVLAVVTIAPIVSAEGEQPSEDRAATVNGSVITTAEFDREVVRAQRQLMSMGRRVDDSQIAKFKGDVLENLIDVELLYQESQREGIKVDDAALDEHVAGVKKQFPSEDEFKEALSKMNVSEDDIRSDFRRGKAIEQLIDGKIAQKVTLSDEEVKKYYDNNPDLFKQPEQIQASHILIKVDADSDESQTEQARKKIEEIQRKLKEGGDFAALAKEFSQGPSGPKGGELGYFGRGQMVKPFEDAAFALKPGDVSDIVQTRFGYHLIKVTDKKAESTVPYDDVKEKLKDYLKKQKIQEEVGLYVENLKAKATVERFLTLEP